LIFIVQEQANPSTDYFVLPALAATKLPLRCCGFDELPSQRELRGASVVFVRYIPRPWRGLIEAAREDIRELVLFMDDDLLDISASRGMPWRYRLKLARLAGLQQAWLRRNRAHLWVSTEYLARKYREWRPRLLQPVPLPAVAGDCRLFYHGSDTHKAEMRWLQPVIAQVLAADERLSFEIIGGRDVRRWYRGMPRVTVVHPMKWSAYQAFLAGGVRHIGLVPELDMPFNRARSHTKFFDISRCGAVGVYAARSACAQVVQDGVEGVVCDMDPGAWVATILRLASDEPGRSRLLEGAQRRVDDLAKQARRQAADVTGPLTGST
jgi:hypothetical protein